MIRSIRIEQDDSPENPRDWGSPNIMLFSNPEYAMVEEGDSPFITYCPVCNDLNADCGCADGVDYRVKGSVWFQNEDGYGRMTVSYSTFNVPSTSTKEEFLSLPEFDSHDDLTVYKLDGDVVAYTTANRHDHGFVVTPDGNPEDDLILYMTRSAFKELYGEEFQGTPEEVTRALILLEQELQTFSDWATGNVYGFIIEETDENGTSQIVDSCWGFYGSDAIEGMSSYMESSEDSELLFTAWEKFTSW